MSAAVLSQHRVAGIERTTVGTHQCNTIRDNILIIHSPDVTDIATAECLQSGWFEENQRL